MLHAHVQKQQVEIRELREKTQLWDDVQEQRARMDEQIVALKVGAYV
jgi:hypothetical protein